MKLPKDVRKRLALLRLMLKEQQTQLEEDIRRYTDLIERGVFALSQYDREIDYGGDDELAVASALALKHNHISRGKGRVVYLRSQVPPVLTE